MGDSLAPREAARPRRESYGGGAQYSGQNQQRHDEDLQWIRTYRENHGAPERLDGEGARVAERRLSVPPQVVHQRHMPVGTQKFHIPRKTKEKLALFQPLSHESREYEDMLTVLTSGYLDSASAGSFNYSQPRLVHSETLEKEFVEKRKELKADGRTEKELEESYCFLLCDSFKLQRLCEKGLFVGQSKITVLGNPQKGVYLSRCSDLLQLSPFTPGASGEILIFKVIKGKVKSIYENMKNLLDPTPRFDSHLSKNISKITSVMSYRAFELTQHYFYEYSFDELRERPRQVCPYAVVSFQFKGKDTPLTSKPMAPLRLNSQSSDKSQEHAQFTVWSGDLVKDDKVLFQISLQSSSPPFLPHKLPERLEMKWAMRWDQATRRLPQSLFSYNLYSSGQEVVKDGFYCSLLEVVDRNRSMTSITKLLLELETKAVALVTPLTERGFLFILSSVQMATAHERGENWKRSLQALFVFPETRCSKSTPQCASEPSPDLVTADSVMPGMNHFVPALHFALGKSRTNPPPELSTGVEQQAREYLSGIKEGVLLPYPVGQYDAELEQTGRQYPVPIMHRLRLDSCLQPYLRGPAQYLLLLSRVRAMVQQLCACPQRPLLQRRVQHSQGDQKMQQLIDLVLSCKRNAEREVQSEMKSGARKRKMVEQEMAQRTIKHLKASQELQHLNVQENTEVASSSPGSLTSLIGSVGLKDTDLRDEGSELAAKLLSLLTSLNQTATNQNTSDPREAGPKESSPFDRLALKLGLPTNCDIDLRKHDDFEGGSVSSQEGFSPVSSFSGDPRTAHRDQDNYRDQDWGLEQNPRRARTAPPAVCEKEDPLQPEIPWILIPITGLPLKHCTRKDTDLPRDPRVHQLVPTALPMEMITTATTTCSPAPFVPSAPSSPDPSPPASPSLCPSPDPSLPPSRCPSPELEQQTSSPNPSPRSSPGPVLEPCSAPEHEVMFNDPRESEELLVSGDTAAEPPPETPIALSPVACTSTDQLSPRPPTPTKTIDLKEEKMRDAETLYRISPLLPLQDIDSIVNRHQDSFSFDVQSILQNQHVTYTFPQSPHSTSQPQHTASTASIARFSQYVSFYHPCPPVQRYVSSLQRQITGVLNDYENNWTPNIPDTTTATIATTDATSTPDLASRISEFVASIRAANNDDNEGDVLPQSRNWQTDSEQEVATSSMDCDKDFIEKTIQKNDVRCSDIETDLDISNNGRRQVQFGSNHIEICIRNEPVAHSSHSRRDIEDVEDLTPESPPGNSDQNALNSLINQLQPEVFTTLVEIIKDIKRNAQHYYIHCPEEDDYTIQQIRAQLSQQSYIEQSPVVFLNQEESSNRKLLVIIKNQDIAAHIHQIPELLSLKKSPSVQFLGVDKADDLRNHSCHELFASGGQVLSDEMVLNPDFVSHEKLSALLSVLEKHSSPENLWRWKVHGKTHKKLKEQSRFRRDAASLLEVLMSFQKHQIVEFLPFHECDMSHGPELLDCAVELQRMYTSFRHTLLLTENCLVNSSGGGVIVCRIDEFLQDFRKLVGYHDDDIQEPIRDESQSTEDPSQSGPVPSEDLVSGYGLGSIPLHSEQDFEVLHRAISQLRAERQQQLRNNQSDTTSEGQGAVSTTDESATDLTASVTTTEQKPGTTPTDKVSNSDGAQLTPGRKAVAATLDLIHSTLHLTNEDRTKDQTRIQTTDSIQDRRSPAIQICAIEEDTNMTTVPINQNRYSETQVTIGQDKNLEVRSPRSVETQLSIDCKKSPETQVQKAVETNGREEPTTSSGSQGSSVPSEFQRGVTVSGKSEPVTATLHPPASNKSLSQSKVEQEKTTTPNSTPERRSFSKHSTVAPPPPPFSSRLTSFSDTSLLSAPQSLPHHLLHPHSLSFPFTGHFLRPHHPMFWGPGLFQGGRVRAPPHRRGFRGGYNGM
ncbi:protein TASOR isoform X2 [Periophthalmus magnuspinnatus]|uniref:protein TASOR isoform X2 n=1 Tax=Periophthalmus magnuspinnatus TaxID=409849 RepID=UPI0024363AE1|nr:protein TASOR isoform X2 [Periophthalmus magnuspinnatus]